MRLGLEGFATICVLALPSCIEDRGFPCTASDACVLDGVQGRCESAGWCSYPDTECGGLHRYEPLAGDGVGGTCIDALCGVTSVIAGADHNCAVDRLDRVWCWGANAFGQLGLGFDSQAEQPARLATVLQGAGAAPDGYLVPESAADHACGLGGGNAVLCWGLNTGSQVTYEEAPPTVLEPLLVGNLAATAVAVSDEISCIATGSALSCWGAALPNDQTVTLQVDDTIRELAAGDRHLCLRTASAGAYCAGEPGEGRLGGEIRNDQPLPYAQPFVAGVRLLAAGHDHSCAVVGDDASQDVLCWGSNESGQCGSSPSDPFFAAPTSIATLAGGTYLGVAAGDAHTCVLREADGHVLCWGDNLSGQVEIGDGTDGFDVKRVELDGEPIVAVQVVAGRRHTCARTASAIVCWGDNASLQLGTDDLAARSHVTPFDCE